MAACGRRLLICAIECSPQPIIGRIEFSCRRKLGILMPTSQAFMIPPSATKLRPRHYEFSSAMAGYTKLYHSASNVVISKKTRFIKYLIMHRALRVPSPGAALGLYARQTEPYRESQRIKSQIKDNSKNDNK